MTKPSICVVAPCYNHGIYLIECLESIIIQNSSLYDLDLIIIDDFSSDNSVDIIENFFLRNNPEKIFRNFNFIKNSKNIGAHANYNTAIELSSADVLHFLNTDDFLGKNRISTVALKYKEHLAASSTTTKDLFWGFGEICLINADSMLISGDGYWQHIIDEMRFSQMPVVSYSFLLIKQNITISTGNIFVSTKLAKLLKGFNDYRYVHDWDFALRCILYVEPVVVRGMENAYMYRHHVGNSFRELLHIGHLESFEVLYRYFSNVILNRPLNRKVLSPFNYGSNLFDYFLKEQPALGQIAERVLHS
jgi:glycosyltransferase involved in cell wall biosynthesis